MVFVIQSPTVVYDINLFVDTEKILHPWDRSYLIMIYNPLNVLLNSVTNILLMIFAPMFISDTGLFTF